MAEKCKPYRSTGTGQDTYGSSTPCYLPHLVTFPHRFLITFHILTSSPSLFSAVLSKTLVPKYRSSTTAPSQKRRSP